MLVSVRGIVHVSWSSMVVLLNSRYMDGFTSVLSTLRNSLNCYLSITTFDIHIIGNVLILPLLSSTIPSSSYINEVSFPIIVNWNWTICFPIKCLKNQVQPQDSDATNHDQKSHQIILNRHHSRIKCHKGRSEQRQPETFSIPGSRLFWTYFKTSSDW